MYLFYPYVEKVWGEPRLAQQGLSTFWLRVLKACKCPKDQMNPGCNFNNLVITLLYDQQWVWGRTVRMAARFQERIVSDAGVKSSNPLGDHLSGLVAYGRGSGFVSHEAPQLNTPLHSFTDSKGKFWDWSFANGSTFNQLLKKEFQKVCGGQCAMIFLFSLSGPLGTSVNAPMDRFDLSLGQLSPNTSLVVDINGTEYGNKYPHMIPVQMCIDTFSQPQALARLSQVPPVRLVQIYFECTSKVSAALMASIGNAAAAARLYVGLSWAAFGVLFAFFLRFRAKQTREVVMTQHTKADLEAAQAQIRNELIWEELKELRAEFVRQKTSPESFLFSRLDNFKPLFYEQHGTPGPEDQEALERVGAEISHRLHQAKQADDKGSAAAYHDGDRIQPHQRVSITLPVPSPAHTFHVTKRQSFTRMRDDDQASSDGRRASRRLSSHPMGFVLSSTQPRSRASLVSSLVRGGSVADIHQL
jgi:hypothetical protein